MSIHPLYLQCLRSSRELCGFLREQGPESIPTSLRNDIGRFKVWAQNSGARRKDANSMSLGHRLREASDVKKMVIKLLLDLNETLQDAMSAVSSLPPVRDQPGAAVESTGAEGTATSEDSDTDSELEPDESNAFEECLLDVSNIVTCLYNLSIAIANPAPRDRLEKSASIDVSHYQQHDVQHVSERFPNAEKYLLDRLGKANSKRRQLLRYYELHHEKVAGQSHTDPQEFDDLELQSLAVTETETVTTISTYVPGDGALEIDVAVGTTAQHMDSGSRLEDDPDFDSRSVTSYASSFGDPDRLRVPPPPDEESAFLGIPFQCPYCFSLAKAESQQSWKRHVFKDLRPYVCTFENCQRSEHLFESRHEWFEHERTLHRREWFCSACRQIFTTDAAFRQHLFHSHTGHVDLEQLQVVIDRSERAIESKQRCNLCHQDALSPHLLQRHIGRHMQQICLFVLPGSAADGESEKTSSDSGDPREASADEEGPTDLETDGAQPEEPANPNSLFTAAERGQLSEVQLLLDGGADIEGRDEDDRTALHLAALHGHVDTVRLLLDRGATISPVIPASETALRLAAGNGHAAVVRLLLDRGADINAATWKGTALHRVAERGREDIVQLLLDHNANIEATTREGHTALHLAAMRGHVDTVRLLLDRGATISPVSPEHETELCLAAGNGHAAVVGLLLDRGADIDAATIRKVTALHRAAVTGNEETVQLLLDRGADIHAIDSEGRTALQMANQYGKRGVVRLLNERRVDTEVTDDASRTAVDLATERRL